MGEACCLGNLSASITWCAKAKNGFWLGGGNIEAQDLVEIRNGGHLEANISTDRVVIEDGGF